MGRTRTSCARGARGTASGWHYLFDADGNVAQRTDASGGVYSATTYDAYGKELAVRTPMGLPAMATDPFGFDARWGCYLDRELGTYCCQNRTYDPSTARWLERDPTGLAGGGNPYSCCRAQPVGNVEPATAPAHCDHEKYGLEEAEE